MNTACPPASGQLPSVTAGITESREHGFLVLSPTGRSRVRRILYVNSYGGASLWEKIKRGDMPPHHLWGCLELVRMGYEVALADALPHFYLYRKPFPHDLKLLKMVRAWLGRDGIIYCGHTLLYWLPLLKWFSALRCRIVSLMFAREGLDFARAHTGIIAMTPAAAEHAKKMAPRVKCVHLGWGADMNYFPRLEYIPESFLSCGIACRDFQTLSLGAAKSGHTIRVICPGLPTEVSWPANVTVTDGGAGWNFQKTAVSYERLLYDYYARCAGSLIILKNDPTEKTAVGFTNLLEAMAMARPVIVTRTGAVPTEIDVEKLGCGLFVPAEDPAALAEAIIAITANPARSRAMGEAGRHLAETHYNIKRYARDLHLFFESLS